MSLIRTTATAVLVYALGLQGRSRKDGTAVWTNSSTIDDCARFCSHVLWGGNPGPISWVDNFKSAADGSYHAGKSGLQPGDVVLFDWEGNGVGNHVEFCLTAPNSRGAFTTIGANGSDTVAAKVRTRSAYVMGYFRPAWGAASPTPMQPNPEESTVTAQKFRDTSNGQVDVIDPWGVADWHIPNQDYITLLDSLGATKQGGYVDVPHNVFQFLQSMRNANVDAIAGSAATKVWGTVLHTGWNGDQTAGNLIVGADRKAGTIDAATLAKVVASIPAPSLALSDAQTTALSTTLAAKILAGIRSLILGK